MKMKLIIEPTFTFKLIERHKKYSQFLMVLSFANEYFRKVCLSKIYDKFSKSKDNRRMVRKNEKIALENWSHQFNHIHKKFRIVKIRPKANSQQYLANCLVNCSCPERLFDASFLYKWESVEAQRVVNNIKTIFNQCVPGITFQFECLTLPQLQIPLTKRHVMQSRPSKTSSRQQSEHHKYSANHLKSTEVTSLSAKNKLSSNRSSSIAESNNSASLTSKSSNQISSSLSDMKTSVDGMRYAVTRWQNRLEKMNHESYPHQFQVRYSPSLKSKTKFSSISSLWDNKSSLSSDRNHATSSSIGINSFKDSGKQSLLMNHSLQKSMNRLPLSSSNSSADRSLSVQSDSPIKSSSWSSNNRRDSEMDYHYLISENKALRSSISSTKESLASCLTSLSEVAASSNEAQRSLSRQHNSHADSLRASLITDLYYKHHTDTDRHSVFWFISAVIIAIIVMIVLIFV